MSRAASTDSTAARAERNEPGHDDLPQDTPDNRDQSFPRTPTAAAHSRWNAKKDLSFVPLRPSLVVEVRYDHMEGNRFRHTAQFVRWREDRDPASCSYAQLEEPVSYDLAKVLGG